MIIGITDYVQPPFDIEQEGFGGEATFAPLNAEHEHEFDLEQLATMEALIVWHAPITAKIADHLTSCKIVVRYGVGYDVIDIPALTEKGIPFCNTPDYGTEEVADTASAMIMSLRRRIMEYDVAARQYQQGWQEHTLSPLSRTNTLTLGVIGVGRIGTAVINRLRAFGYRIIGYDPYQPSGHEKAIGYERASSLQDLLAAADVVTLHCPETPETAGMVNGEFIAAMKPGAHLVVTARGGLIDSLDTIEQGLRNGHLAAAGLDVLPDEPPGDHSLIQAWKANEPWMAGRLIINPLTSYFSEQAWREMRFKAAETVRIFRDTGTLRNHITAKSLA